MRVSGIVILALPPQTLQGKRPLGSEGAEVTGAIVGFGVVDGSIVLGCVDAIIWQPHATKACAGISRQSSSSMNPSVPSVSMKPQEASTMPGIVTNSSGLVTSRPSPQILHGGKLGSDGGASVGTGVGCGVAGVLQPQTSATIPCTNGHCCLVKVPRSPSL